MKDINTYLIFDGNCREAMKFYQSCLGGELLMMPFSEAPADAGIGAIPREAQARLMHAKLTNGPAILMASDTMPGMAHKQGDNFSVSVNCDSLEDIQKTFTAFSEKGKITMPLQDAFWGARFGMLTDQFGVNWMFSFEKPKQS